MQILKPLAILDIGFSTWNIFDMPGVDQHDLETIGIQYLKDGNPIDTSGFHGN